MTNVIDNLYEAMRAAAAPAPSAAPASPAPTPNASEASSPAPASVEAPAPTAQPRRERRNWTDAAKRQILSEIAQLRSDGRRGDIARYCAGKGLAASTVSLWRRQLAAGGGRGIRASKRATASRSPRKIEAKRPRVNRDLAEAIGKRIFAALRRALRNVS